MAVQREEEEITPGQARESRHISEWIDCTADVVYDYASDPAHLPEWAHGLGDAVERVGDEWFVATGMGRVGVAFAPRNELGVLDHRVTLPSGETFYNPMHLVTLRQLLESRRGRHK